MNEKATQTSQEFHERPATPVGWVAISAVLAIVVIVLAIGLHREKTQAADARTQLAEQTSQDTQTKSDLDKANAQVASVQAQLDSSKAQVADLQQQLHQANSRQADTQAELDKAKGEATDLRSQLEGSKAQIGDLQNKVSQSDSATSDLRKQLEDAKRETSDLRSQLAKAQSDLAQGQTQAGQPSQHQLPIQTSFKSSGWGRFWSNIFGGGYALAITNQNQGPLALKIQVSSGDKNRTQSSTVQPGATLDVGHLSAGDNVLITSDGFEPTNVTVK